MAPKQEEKDDLALTFALMMRDKSKTPEWMQLALDFEFIDDCAQKKMDQQTVFKHLIEGSSPNARSRREGEEGWTPLMYEADRGYGSSLRILFTYNPDPNLKSDAGETALMIACRKNNHEVFKELIIEFKLANGTLDMNALNNEGKSALLIAAELGHGECVNGLTNHGANPDLRDREGRTALIISVQGKHAACANSLMKNGADVMLKDNAGKTALDYARETEQPQVVAALEIKRREYLDKMGDEIDNGGLESSQQVKVAKPLAFKKGPK
ncbi:MAG: ankyrin repeat domain-containing protein [Alphaproteobacteria bacterium]